MDDLLEQLAAPFPPEKISWRVGSTTTDKSKGMILAYLTARDVMQRLDDVVGADKWEDYYSETASGRVICSLTLTIGDAKFGVTKSDGAGDTGFEGAKGAISDAFKRAAVKWGIGRYLYDVKAPWVPLENGYLPKGFNGNQYLKDYKSLDYMKVVRDNWSSIDFIKLNLVEKPDAALEAWRELGEDTMRALWRAPSKGGVFETSERSGIDEASAADFKRRKDAGEIPEYKGTEK